MPKGKRIRRLLSERSQGRTAPFLVRSTIAVPPRSLAERPREHGRKPAS